MKTKTNIPLISLLAVLGVITQLGTLQAAAKSLSWSGASVSSANWADSANWGSAGTPANGDTLIFTALQPRQINTNNLTGLVLSQIRFSGPGGGYAFWGNSFTLTNSIEATNTVGANTINNAITLGASPVTVNVSNAVSLTLAGVLGGTGGLTKTGSGTLTYNANNNSYTGTTRVNDGTLQLNCYAVDDCFRGPLIIGDGTGSSDSAVVKLLLDAEMPNSTAVTINSDGKFDLNNLNETIGSSLTLNGGDITTGSATLTLSDTANITVSSYPSISGSLNIGGGTCTIQGSGGLALDASVSGSANIVKNGGVYVAFYAANPFTGTLTATDGEIYVANSLALGTTSGGTIINGSAYLWLANIGVTNEALTMNSTHSYALAASSGSANYWVGSVSLSRDTMIYVGTSSSLNIMGEISGVGGVTKWAPGTLVFSGSSSNPYSGNTVVNEGILELRKSPGTAITYGSLIIGDGWGGIQSDIVREMAADQIYFGVPITIRETGLLALNNYNDSIGPLVLNGGDLTTGTGTVTLHGNVTVVRTSPTNTSGLISGKALIDATRTFFVSNDINLDLDASVAGSYGITKTGLGELYVWNSNSYSGLTIVAEGLLWPFNSFALGDSTAGTVVSNSATLYLGSAINVTNEALILHGPAGPGARGYDPVFLAGNQTIIWAGPVTLAADSAIDTWDAVTRFEIYGPIDGPGGLKKRGPGTLLLGGSTANTYAGTTWVDAGTLLLNKTPSDGAIPHDLIIGDGSGGANADVVRFLRDNQINNANCNVTINSSGLFDLNGNYDRFNGLTGNGNMQFGSGGYAIPGHSDASSTYSGVASGDGYIWKVGTGVLTLTGNNTYTGVTRANEGTLLMNGSQPQSAVQVDSSGTLGGAGTVGHITASGIVSPGTSCGPLTSSNVVFGAAGSLSIELCGNASFDQLNARGTVNLTGAALGPLTVAGGFLPKEGDQFIIVNNDASDAVTGTFDSLSEGAVATSGNFRFRVSYAGGSGNNDVVLIMTNQFLKPGAGLVLSGNGNGGIEPNECNLLSLIVSNLSTATMSGLVGTLQSLTPGVVVVQPISTYPNIPINSRRTNDSLFQITTLPFFGCTNSVDLELEVVTTTHGTLKVPFSLPSGVTGTVVRYNDSVTTAIPDNSFLDRTFTVSGITTPLKKVVVSLHITHTADSDLDISLIGPDGTTVDLSSDNGGTSSDYGTDCTDAHRTTFDSTAGTPIWIATAPFVGTYGPEESLAVFKEKTGSAVNGTWRLRIADDTPGGVGSIRCWSLFLFPTACTPGSGICELCPEVTLTSSLGATSTQQTGRLTRNGGVSACGSQKIWPGINDSIAHSYDAFTFQNGPSDACVTVTLQSPAADVFSVAYTNSFNPASIAANYRADAAYSTAGGVPRSYGFSVAADQVFVVTVNEVTAGAGGEYSLSVTGGDCRPVLNITRADPTNMKLDWTTAAAGYQLQCTNPLTGTLQDWTTVTTTKNPPLVVGGKFTVTNAMNIDQNFYRLQKP